MRSRLISAAALVAATLACVAILVTPAAGQAPAGAAARPAAQAPANWTPPRTPDGQPDIQGFWAQRGRSIPSYSLEEGPSAEHYAASGQTPQKDRPSAVVDPPDGKAPYQPWAAAQRKAVYDNHNNLKRRNQVDPQDRCLLNGATRFFSLGNFQLLQTPGRVVLLNTIAHSFRIIRLDGSPHLGDSIKLWQGDSRGRWEGNTLVVTTTSHNDKTWFDKVGSFHSDELRVVERFTFVDPTTIDYRATVEDSKVFTRPWTIGLTIKRNTEGEQELMEEACFEGDKFGKESFAALPN